MEKLEGESSAKGTKVTSITEVGLPVRVGVSKKLKLGLSVRLNEDIRGWHPLHLSTFLSLGNFKYFEELLKCEHIDINCRTPGGETALCIACRVGHDNLALQAVEMLLRAGADVNIANNKGQTPLLLSLFRVHLNITRALLDAPQVDVDIPDRDGIRPLSVAAAMGKADFVRVLLASGADITAKDRFNMTSLHNATRYGRLECLKLLLGAGKDRCPPNLVNEAFLFAVIEGITDCVEVLLAYGTEFSYHAALIDAVKKKHPEIVKLILADLRFTKDEWGKPLAYHFPELEKNLLHLAVECQSYDCLRVLLEAGFPVDCTYWRPSHVPIDRPMPFYQNALKFALKKNDFEAVKILLGAGAKVNSCQDGEIEPLICTAVKYGTSKEIDLMIDHGAEFESLDVLMASLEEPDNLSHILRRGADPSSCFTSDSALFANSVLELVDQEAMFRALEIVMTFHDHKPQAFELLTTLAASCREVFEEEYDDQGWSRLLNSVRTPSSLMSLCRTTLRRHLLRLYGTTVGDRIKALHLPQLLISYISHEDILL